LCAGLSAIHAQGILHRDIKTHNVMLTANDGDRAAAGRSERALLLDFGIARAIDSRAAPLTTGGVAGTPDYMAPEQLKGEALSPAADLYALGVVLFELLTGRLPFPSEGSMAGVFKRLQAPPSPPSAWAPAIPRVVDELTVWCLQPRPEHRPHSAEVLRAAIADILAGKPVALPAILEMRAGSSQETGPAQALPSSSTRRSRAGVSIAAFVLVAAALAWAARARVSAPKPRASSTPSSPAARPTAHADEAASERGNAPAGPAPQELSTPVVDEADEAAVPRAGLSALQAVGPSGVKAGKKALPAGQAKAAPVAPSASCTPPYYYDERGLRVYRKDCL
jgi:serine/threonine-protein kinase